jgi:hypothetical protein
LAARLQALAEPNAVVISSSTRRLTGGLFEYHDLGSVALKGFAENVQTWQVLGAGAAESRFEALRSAHHQPLGNVIHQPAYFNPFRLLVPDWVSGQCRPGGWIHPTGH